MEHPEETKPYEDKPIAFGIIWKAVVVLFLVAAFIHVLIWAEFRELDNYKKQVDPRVSPLQPKQQIPPGPHLEAQKPAVQGTDEPFDQKNLIPSRAQEKVVLESYSWADAKNGVVRIPIDVAMKKVVAMELQKQPK